MSLCALRGSMTIFFCAALSPFQHIRSLPPSDFISTQAIFEKNNDPRLMKVGDLTK